MPNTKGFKLSFFLSSFRLCRPKNPSSFPKTPTPKPFHISYPPPGPPPPPPSTPNHASSFSSQVHDPYRKSRNFLNNNNAMGKSTPKKPRGNTKKNKNVGKSIYYSSPETEVMKERPTTKSSKNSRKKVKIQKHRRRNRMSNSYAMVVKTSSKDPHLDFKNSMMEMILDKQLFDAKELEQLLHCFLSLNSKHHVPAIISAFTDVWETLFCKITPQINVP